MLGIHYEDLKKLAGVGVMPAPAEFPDGLPEGYVPYTQPAIQDPEIHCVAWEEDAGEIRFVQGYKPLEIVKRVLRERLNSTYLSELSRGVKTLFGYYSITIKNISLLYAAYKNPIHKHCYILTGYGPTKTRPVIVEGMLHKLLDTREYLDELTNRYHTHLELSWSPENAEEVYNDYCAQLVKFRETMC